MDLDIDFESVFEKSDTWDTEEKCPLFGESDIESLRFVYIKCKCEKRLKTESYEDFFIPLSSPTAAKCGDPICRKQGTLRCTYCDKVYCKACVKTHLILDKHNNHKHIMPYPAKEKKFISCLSCKQDDRRAELYCIPSLRFVCAPCYFRFHHRHPYKFIVYIGNEMKLVFCSDIIWNRKYYEDSLDTNQSAQNSDSDRVPVPKTTRFMDYIPATTAMGKEVLIKNRGKYYPPPPAAVECDPIIACACCGRKAEKPVKCVSCKRSYHHGCHIPALPEETTDEASMAKWKCTMCLDIAKLVSEKTPGENANQGAKRFPLGEVEKKIAERILMELYCRGHDSQHYEVCPPRQSSHRYYSMIAHPVSLNDVRERLSSDTYYSSFGRVIKDLFRVFSNGLVYYWPGDARRNAALNLQDSLKKMLRKWMPAMVRPN